MLTLEPSDEQRSFAASVTTLLSRQVLAPGRAPQQVWSALGQIGLLGIGTVHVGGDSLDMIAGMRAAGAAGCQGPFLGAFLAARLLDDGVDELIAGSATASVIGNGIAAWGVDASTYLQIGQDRCVELVEAVSVTPFQTLAGEPWARVSTRMVRSFGIAATDLGFVELARGAWMVGAAETLLALAAEHARVRQQFGKRIGDFQAVAHPLANAAAEVGAASDSVFLAALRLEREGDAAPAAAASVAATRAGLQAAFASHQAHGALGFTVERGLDRLTAGIRQMSLHPPDPSVARSMCLGRWLA